MHPCPTCEREPNKGLAGIECEDVVSVADQSLKKEQIYFRYGFSFMCNVRSTLQSNIIEQDNIIGKISCFNSEGTQFESRKRPSYLANLFVSLSFFKRIFKWKSRASFSSVTTYSHLYPIKINALKTEICVYNN